MVSVKVWDAVLKCVSVVLSFFLAAIVLIICLQTFYRYVVFHSLPWSEELSRYLFVLIVACGFGIGISKGSLIRIGIIDGYVGPRGMLFMRILYAAAGVLVCVVLSLHNLPLIKTGMTRLTSALAPMRFGHLYMAMEAGFILSTLASVLQFLKSIAAFYDYGRGDGR